MKNKKRNKTNSAGISLVSVLCYVFIMAVVINLGANVYISVMRLHEIGSKTLENTASIREVQREFRQVAKKATGMRQSFGTFQRSPDCLLFQLPPGDESGAENIAVFMKMADSDKTNLRRIELSGRGDAYEVTFQKTYNVVFEELTLETSPNARAVTMRCALASERTPQSAPPVYTTVAALGGIAGLGEGE